eukprot:jgi/Chrpa1/3217/Chrysochromulina_OHIO_Genome00014641-RA
MPRCCCPIAPTTPAIALSVAGTVAGAVGKSGWPMSEATSGIGSRDMGSCENCLQWRLSAPREQSRMPHLHTYTLPHAFMCIVRSSLTTNRFFPHLVHAKGLSPEKWRRR